MIHLPTCTSRLVVQHPCQISFKSMQGCRRSWEDKLKCVKILSVKDHNSAKICRTWFNLPTCTSRLVVQYLYRVSFKSMQRCRRSWKDKLWCNGRTEWRTKQTLNAPLPFYGGGIKKISPSRNTSPRELSLRLLHAHLLEIHKSRLVDVQHEPGSVIAYWVTTDGWL